MIVKSETDKDGIINNIVKNKGTVFSRFLPIYKTMSIVLYFMIGFLIGLTVDSFGKLIKETGDILEQK